MNRYGDFIFGAALLLALSGCDASPTPPSESRGRVESEPPQALAARMGLTLPPGARIEQAKDMSGQDAYLRMVVVLPEAAWLEFLQDVSTNAGSEPIFLADNNNELGPPGKGWRPADAPGLTTAQLPSKDGLAMLNIGLTQAGPYKVRLFLVWWHL
jgi:hypothetical protein